MRGYVDLDDYRGLGRVFDEILDKEVMLWNVVILGYMKFGCASEVQGLLVKAEQGGVPGFV